MIQVPEPVGAAPLVVLSETDAYFTCPDADIRENAVINSDAIHQYILILKGDKSQQTFFVDIPSSHQSPVKGWCCELLRGWCSSGYLLVHYN